MEGDSGSLANRLKRLILKPEASPPDEEKPQPPRPSKAASVEELEVTSKRANDKERLVGLIAAPLAAAIGILITDHLISVNKASRSTYESLMLVLVVLAVVMLITALMRKRLFLAMALALYGLAVFNLKYWGFGVPFLLFGAWMLVQAYRGQRDLKEAREAADAASAAKGGGGLARPSASKRYTPPSSSRR